MPSLYWSPPLGLIPHWCGDDSLGLRPVVQVRHGQLAVVPRSLERHEGEGVPEYPRQVHLRVVLSGILSSRIQCDGSVGAERAA